MGSSLPKFKEQPSLYGSDSAPPITEQPQPSPGPAVKTVALPSARPNRPRVTELGTPLPFQGNGHQCENGSRHRHALHQAAHLACGVVKGPPCNDRGQHRVREVSPTESREPCTIQASPLCSFGLSSMSGEVLILSAYTSLGMRNSQPIPPSTTLSIGETIFITSQ